MSLFVHVGMSLFVHPLVHKISLFQARKQEGLIVKYNIQERAVNHEAAIVFDESEPAELVHEEIDATSRGSNQFSEGLLRDGGDGGIGPPIFSILGQEEQGAGQTLFRGIEQLVN